MFGNFGGIQIGPSDILVEQVWQKGTIVPDYDSSAFRKDCCGAWIQRDQYGNRQSKLGWELDHIAPASLGGSNSLSNLRPLQWENNASRQNGPLSCPVSAYGNVNVSRWHRSDNKQSVCLTWSKTLEPPLVEASGVFLFAVLGGLWGWWRRRSRQPHTPPFCSLTDK